LNAKSLILLLPTVIPWITAPLIRKSEWKRFSPVVVFITIVISVESYFAHKHKWWIFPKGTILYYLKDASYMAGPFFVGTLWVLKLTYGHFRRYMLLNILLDAGFVYVLMNILQKYNIMKLVRLKKYQFFSFFMIKALLIYGFQYLKEKIEKT
jgi:hypothetical protein